jgi:integrase/recombinase XerC
MNELQPIVTAEIAVTERSQELITRWLSFVDGSPKTSQTYTRAIAQFFKYLAEQGISNPQREDIIAYREYLKADHKPTTIQAYMIAVKLFFRWLAQEGLYNNIADRVKGAKLDREHKKDYLTSKQLNKLLASIDRSTEAGKRDYAIIALMSTTGLRTISVISADIGDIRAAGDATALYYKGKGHTEKATYVKLSEKVEGFIREYLQARGEADSQAPLFASVAHRNGGERLTTRSLSRLVKERLNAIGLTSDRLTAHSLRHTAATLNLLSGGSVEETQQLLNHSNISTTMIYSHALDRAKNNSEYRISKAIFG